jgi:CHAT domain
MFGTPIRIIVGIEKGLYRIEVIAGANSIPPFDSAAPAEDISNFRQEYRTQLHQARQELGDANPYCEIAGASRGLRRLHALGSQFLFKVAPHKAAELTGLFEARKNLEAILDPASAPLSIVLDAPPSVFFPIEILPLKDTRPQEIVRGWKGLRDQAGCFVGMSAIVRRLALPPPDDASDHGPDPSGRGSGYVDQDKKLSAYPMPVKVFYNATLKGANDEIEFFRRHSDKFLLEGPWPEDRYRDQMQRVGRSFMRMIGSVRDRGDNRYKSTATIVAQHMRNPSLGFNGRERAVFDQIQHFSCHCQPSEAHPGSYVLRLCSKRGGERNVETTEMEEVLLPLLNIPLNSPLPLIFLNACATGITVPGDFDSLVRIFTTSGSRAVVSTQAAIPDRFGAAFSEAFYNELLVKQRRTVGQALHNAKWEMLNLENNPLGLLYTLHGNPDLQVM